MDPIDSDDSWKVIDSYFKMNGLVTQQIQSFEGFLKNSVQEVINEFKSTKIVKERQYVGLLDEEATYEVIFGNVAISSTPRYHEGDGSFHPLWPHEARIRSMTYQTEIFVDVELTKTSTNVTENGYEH